MSQTRKSYERRNAPVGMPYNPNNCEIIPPKFDHHPITRRGVRRALRRIVEDYEDSTDPYSPANYHPIR